MSGTLPEENLEEIITKLQKSKHDFFVILAKNEAHHKFSAKIIETDF